jgi:broad specificity phosphatase PhoE
MEVTRLLLFRHAEVEEKYQRVFGGRIDMDLSSRGHEQAAALAKHIAAIKFDAIYASPMRRVQQTLAPFLAATPHTPRVLADLREIDFGDWTGLVWEDACAQLGVKSHQWLEVLSKDLVANAEPIPAYNARVSACLRHIAENHPGQTVGVFCHGGVIRTMIANALGLTLPVTGFFSVNYASVTELEFHPGGRFVLESLNHIPWRNGK